MENAECGKCGVWKMRSVENAESDVIFMENAESDVIFMENAESDVIFMENAESDVIFMENAECANLSLIINNFLSALFLNGARLKLFYLFYNIALLRLRQCIHAKRMYANRGY